MTEAQRDILRPILIVLVLALICAWFVMNPLSGSPMGQAEQERQKQEQSDPSFNPNDDGIAALGSLA